MVRSTSVGFGWLPTCRSARSDFTFAMTRFASAQCAMIGFVRETPGGERPRHPPRAKLPVASDARRCGAVER